jgi:hypothetical protein
VSGRATETSGRIQAGTVASRYSRGPDGKCTLSRRMMLVLTGVRTVWYVVQTDGKVVRTADRDSEKTDRDSENFFLESSAESSDITLNSGILDKSIFTNK